MLIDRSRKFSRYTRPQRQEGFKLLKGPKATQSPPLLFFPPSPFEALIKAQIEIFVKFEEFDALRQIN